jgi:hypothetical protein
MSYNQVYDAQAPKREEADTAEPKNNFDFNQLLGADQNMLFGFPPNSSNPNIFFESFLMNMCNSNTNPGANQHQAGVNVFDFEGKNGLNPSGTTNVNNGPNAGQ